MDLSTVEHFPETPVPPQDREEQWTNLLDRARRGDSEACGSLLDRCRSYLLRIANQEIPPKFKPLVPPSDAVQEAFLLAQGKLDSFRGVTEQEFARWMRAITVNHLRRKVGSQRRRNIAEGAEQIAQRLRQTDLENRTAGEPERHLEQQERQQALLLALAALPDHYRSVVELRNLERMSFEEIGRLLDRTADASRKLWIRALTMIREKLQEFDAGSTPPSR
jgi:RNA polymerase sigma-70 factor (ECF subfamily)